MKPRIKRHPFTPLMPLMGMVLEQPCWICEGGDAYCLGHTPQQAYAGWAKQREGILKAEAVTAGIWARIRNRYCT